MCVCVCVCVCVEKSLVRAANSHLAAQENARLLWILSDVGVHKSPLTVHHQHEICRTKGLSPLTQSAI